MLCAHRRPELPAAGTILLQLLTLLGGPKGLNHAESHVKQISVDLVGLLGAQFFADGAHEELNPLQPNQQNEAGTFL